MGKRQEESTWSWRYRCVRFTYSLWLWNQGPTCVHLRATLEYMSSRWICCQSKFMCSTHRKVKQTEIQAWNKERFIAGSSKKNRQLMFKNHELSDGLEAGLQQHLHQFNLVQSLSRVRLFTTPWTAAHQASSPTPRVYSNSCLLSRWGHPTISSSVVPFSSCPQSFPASGSFPRSQLFASGGQSIGVSASTSVLSMNTQDWSPLGWTDWISLQSKGLSRVFSNTTVQKHQFFCAQLSL